jgi:hypothetical protein
MGKSSDNVKQATATTPRFRTPSVRIPQPDGSVLIKAGKPILEAEEIRVPEFSRRTGLSRRYVQYLCEIGKIDCRRMSDLAKSWYLIPTSELDRYLQFKG